MNWLQPLKALIDNFFSNQNGLSCLEVKKRMAGVSVFAISSGSEEDRCSVLSDSRKRTIEFFFFSEPEAEAFVQNYNKSNDTSLGIHTIRIPLTEFVDSEGIGHPVRLVPELSQVKNANEEILRKNIAASPHDVHFSGVPVFQADYLSFVRPSGKTYHPLFLRKEDLERTLAGYDKTNESDIQVFSLEEVIQAMKDCSTSKWNDAVIVAPGLTLWMWNRWYQQCS